MKKIFTLIALAVMALAAQAEMIDGHEYVDLGLPSGTLWATCNVGADTPEGYGGHFAWGETEAKDIFDNNYKWLFEGKFTKYCTDSDQGYNGFTDGKTELDPEDDAAYINWGTSWRIPTEEQQKELMNNCYWEMTTINGVNGRLGTGPNGNSIFLPAAGLISSWSNDQGSGAAYSSRNIDELIHARFMGFDSDYLLYSGGSARSFGFSIRAVVEINEPPTPTEKTEAPTFNGYTTDGIHAYFVEILESEPSAIYYRVQYPDGIWTDWGEYEDILTFTENGSYVVEAYAVAPGKLPSDENSYEFAVGPSTGMSELMNGKAVASVRYYNMAGQEMPQANGMTIVVTTYTDGTTNAVKVIK